MANSLRTMKILWLSGRRMGVDLACSTESSLCDELMKNGMDVTLISPGKVKHQNYKHIPLDDIQFPGLTSIIGSIRGYKKIEEIEGDYDLLIVDWRFIFPLFGFRKISSIPWMIIDRGPPAMPGFLSWLQKLQWRMAWRFSSKHSIGGFVVSNEHGKYVRSTTGFNKSLEIVPAGSYQNPFPIKKTDPNKKIILSYVGRLDKKREVDCIFQLSKCLSKKMIKHRIDVCGVGDYDRHFKLGEKVQSSIRYYGKVPEREVFHLLSKSHVGVMPMPDIPIWKISSTLKLAKYLSSGLAVIGPRHSGNGSDIGGKWNLLQETNWIQESVNLISNISQSEWQVMSLSAIKSFESLHWEKIGKDMARAILEKKASLDHRLD